MTILNSHFSHLIEHELQSKTVFTGDFMHVKRDLVRLPNNQEGVREYLLHPGAAAILPFDKNGKLILEYQYRYAVGQVMIEIPAGKLEKGEDSLANAKRELLEETGYSGGNWHYLGSCLPAVGYANERIAYYLATDLCCGTATPDVGEFVEVATFEFNEALNMVYDGTITDSKTIVGLMLCLGHFKSKKPLG